jgi:hypothetical protein
MTMFGDEDKSARKYNLKSYIEALKANGLIVPAVVTRLTFDDNATVPKLHLSPVRVLTEAEFNLVAARVADDEVKAMLDDVDLKSEEGKPVNVTVAAPAPAPAPAPVVPQASFPPPSAPPAVATAPAAPAAPTRSRGRQPKAETAPAAAAAPSGFPTSNGGAAEPAAAHAPPPVASTAPPGFAVDLDAFDA